MFAVLLSYLYASVSVVLGFFHFFVPHAAPADTLSGALYMLSTLVEALASIIGITIAVLFITVQTTNRPNFTRAINELYSDRTLVVFLLFFFAALIADILSLSFLAPILTTPLLWILDLDVALSLAAILLLAPVVLLQVENMNPLFLAVKLCARVTARRIRAYQLANVDDDPTDTGRYKCTLNIWGQQHGLLDPLGAVHEVIMIAVQNRDRVLLSGLSRTLLRRIARYAGVPYSTSNRPHGRFWKLWRWFYLRTHWPIPKPDQLAVTLHLLHYTIRRSQNLRREWGELDMLRQQYLLNLHDLIEALAYRKNTGQVIELCLCAVMHIELGYGHIPPQKNSRSEVLSTYFSLLIHLVNQGYTSEGILVGRMLGFLSIRTPHLNVGNHDALIASLPKEIRNEYEAWAQKSRSDLTCVPNDEDPWAYFLSSYPVLQPLLPDKPPHAIVDLPMKAQIALALRSPTSGLDWVDDAILKARKFEVKETLRRRRNH